MENMSKDSSSKNSNRSRPFHHLKIAVAMCGMFALIGGLGFSTLADKANAQIISPPTERTVEENLAISDTVANSTVSESSSIKMYAVALTSASKPRYITLTNINPRTGLSTGSSIGTASANYKVYGTGQVKSGHTQIAFFGRSGWVKSNQLKRISVASYKTKKTAVLYAGPGTGSKLATVLTDYTVGTIDNVKTKNGAWTKVQHKGKTGWLSSSILVKAAIDAPEGPGKGSYSNAAYASEISNHIRKYCGNVKIEITTSTGVYYAQSSPEKIVISRNYSDPTTALMKAISLHECAHIKTFRIYKDFSKLQTAAQKINPNKDKIGVEHLADCMADVMGAKRTGQLSGGGTYRAGYGGTCSAQQKIAANKLVQGKMM